MKASAGTLFRAPLLRCELLDEAVHACRRAGFRTYVLAADAAASIFERQVGERELFILGNESDGVSAAVSAAADEALAIPMANGVESLNVAMTAGLIAYLER